MVFDKKFSYEIKKKICTLSLIGEESKELNLISYGNRPAKFDLRIWKEGLNGQRIMCKGVTLSRAEAQMLRDYLTQELKQEEEEQA